MSRIKQLDPALRIVDMQPLSPITKPFIIKLLCSLTKGFVINATESTSSYVGLTCFGFCSELWLTEIDWSSCGARYFVARHFAIGFCIHSSMILAMVMVECLLIAIHNLKQLFLSYNQPVVGQTRGTSRRGWQQKARS